MAKTQHSRENGVHKFLQAAAVGVWCRGAPALGRLVLRWLVFRFGLITKLASDPGTGPSLVATPEQIQTERQNPAGSRTRGRPFGSDCLKSYHQFLGCGKNEKSECLAMRKQVLF
jgi:hypothetical protein